MLSQQMSKGQGFGVVLIKKGQEAGFAATPYQIGVAVEIIDFDQQANGLLQISCLGTKRFQINSLSRLEDNLLSANISWLPEIETKVIESGQSELANLLSDLSKHPQVDIIDAPEKWQQLNFVLERLTEYMPMDEKQKQAILEESSLQLRTNMLYKILAWLK